MEVTPTQSVAVTDSSGVAQARRRCASLAAAIGFGEQAVARVSLVATEIGTNLVKHAGGGELLVSVVENGGLQGLDVLGLDTGPGMADIGRCMADGYSTAGGPGTGLGAIARLSHDMDVFSQVKKGAAVLARLWPDERKERASGELDIGAVVIAKPGETACGDAVAHVRNPGGVLVLGADGLGHGIHAAEASRAACLVLERAGQRRPAEILAETHQALRSTRGAAVAVADIDFESESATLAGIGNLTGALLTGGQMKRMISDNGIVGHVSGGRIRETSYPCAKEAVFVLHSDGLRANWNAAAYPGLFARRSSLIAGVLYRDFKRGRDDSLVVVAKRTGR